MVYIYIHVNKYMHLLMHRKFLRGCFTSFSSYDSRSKKLSCTLRQTREDLEASMWKLVKKKIMMSSL